MQCLYNWDTKLAERLEYGEYYNICANTTSGLDLEMGCKNLRFSKLQKKSFAFDSEAAAQINSLRTFTARSISISRGSSGAKVCTSCPLSASARLTFKISVATTG